MLAELGDPLFETTEGDSVEPVRRLPRAGTRIRLVLFPPGRAGRFALKLLGASAAASDLATVSLGPNSLTSRPGVASHLRADGDRARRLARPSEMQFKAQIEAVNAFDESSGRGGYDTSCGTEVRAAKQGSTALREQGILRRSRARPRGESRVRRGSRSLLHQRPRTPGRRARVRHPRRR